MAARPEIVQDVQAFLAQLQSLEEHYYTLLFRDVRDEQFLVDEVGKSQAVSQAIGKLIEMFDPFLKEDQTYIELLRYLIYELQINQFVRILIINEIFKRRGEFLQSQTNQEKLTNRDLAIT